MTVRTESAYNAEMTWREYRNDEEKAEEARLQLEAEKEKRRPQPAQDAYKEYVRTLKIRCDARMRRAREASATPARKPSKE